MDKNLEPYVEIKNEDITFYGDTPKEKELNEWLYNTTLELNRYQDMVQELLELLQRNKNNELAYEIWQFIVERGC